MVSGIESAFDKFREHNPNMNPMTVVRGTRVPSGWKGDARGVHRRGVQRRCAHGGREGDQYDDQAVHGVGVRRASAVLHGGAHPRRASGQEHLELLRGEDEVILPMGGSHLRCVHVEHNGIAGKPTVYLVGEDLVAEAEDTHAGGGWKKAS